MDYEATKGYQQTKARKDILNFSFHFQAALMVTLKDKFNLLPIDPPLITEFNKSDLKTLIHGSRSISFDADSISKFLEIPTSFDTYRRKIIDDYEIDVNEGIIFTAPIIMRDAKLGNDKALKWNQLEIELRLPNESNKSFQFISNFLQELSSALEIALLLAMQDMEKPLNKDPKFASIPIKTVTSLKKKYGSIADKEKEYLESQESNLYFICNDTREVGNVLGRSFHFHPQSHRRLYHTRLISSVPLLGTYTSLAEIAFSCNYQEQLEQVSSFMNPENDPFSKYLRSNKSKTTVGIKLYLPRIIMYALDLCHIAEATKSEWDEDFMLFVKKQGMKIL